MSFLSAFKGAFRGAAGTVSGAAGAMGGAASRAPRAVAGAMGVPFGRKPRGHAYGHTRVTDAPPAADAPEAEGVPPGMRRRAGRATTRGTLGGLFARMGR